MLSVKAIQQEVSMLKRRISACASRLTAVVLAASMIFSLCSCTKNKDDFDGVRFANTRSITVLVDSKVEGNSGSSVNDSAVARYIRASVLKECNIDVKFIPSDTLNFQNGVSPDITYSDNYNVLTSYYRMNGAVNMAPYLTRYKDSLSDLTEFLGDENIYSCTDDPSEVWFLSPRFYSPFSRITFIRGDWLDKLGLEAPSTTKEFHECLKAFRDNADILLGENASEMIPFFIDNEPNISAKPLLDSCFDTAIDERDIYLHGYCRATQPGYKDGLKILNNWYLQGLLPEDFYNIRPGTKESYEPIENGYVGAFCSGYDYLYMNGDNSHIKALQANCGEGAYYVPVNTFENSHGKYTAWSEDYIHEGGDKIVLPSTCSDPLACLVYLNWISNTANIVAIEDVGKKAVDGYTSSRYLLVYQRLNENADIADKEAAEKARQVASDVNYIQMNNKCIRYWPNIYSYVNSEFDIKNLYPDSTRNFCCTMISAKSNSFDNIYDDKFMLYCNYGAGVIYQLRYEEWDKVVVNGEMDPW